MITTEFLSVDEYSKFKDWLKIQDEETRQLYFGVAGSQHVIKDLMARVLASPDNHYFLVAKDGNRWVGTIHMAVTKKIVEFGVIVSNEYRGQGIAGEMLEEALLWARNRGYKELFMHCLTRNTAIRHLCEKHGLRTTNMLGDSEAKVNLAPPDMVTLAKEAVYKQRNIFHMWLQDTKSFYQEIYG